MNKKYGWVIENTEVGEFVNNNYGTTPVLANARVFSTRKGACTVKGDIDIDRVREVILDKNDKPIIVRGR